MVQLHSYPSIYNIGHHAIQELFLDPVVVEEKVDGSQFSFGVAMVGDPEGPEYGQSLLIRSKGARIDPQNPPKLFARAVATVNDLWAKGLLAQSVVYRGEVLDTPHHNTLTYGRVPVGHIVLFDIDTPGQTFLSPEMKETEAVRIGLEVVPHLYSGMVQSAEELKVLLGRESFLGGPKIEGIVIKNYARFGRDKKVLMGKWVREEFKEANRVAHVAGPSTQDQIVTRLKTDARWRKAIQHLRENGQLQNAPQDIGPLLKEIAADTLKEHQEEIKQALFDGAWKYIIRGINAGFPEFYKERLAESAFPQIEEKVAA